MKRGNLKVNGAIFLSGCVFMACLAHLADTSSADQSANVSSAAVPNAADADANGSDYMMSNSAAVAQADSDMDGVEISEAEAHEVAPSDDADTSNDSGGQSCTATVLQRVAALEDATSTMKPGDEYDSVTQFWRNERTGATWFCAHGSYCYPATVSVNGETVDAIRLTNCHIGQRSFQDGDEVEYAVE